MSDAKKTTQEQIQDNWKQAMTDHSARMEAFQQEWTSLERKNTEQAMKNMDEAARLFRESLNYSTQMMNEWRRLSLEGTRRAAAFMTTPWT